MLTVKQMKRERKCSTEIKTLSLLSLVLNWLMVQALYVQETLSLWILMYPSYETLCSLYLIYVSMYPTFWLNYADVCARGCCCALIVSASCFGYCSKVSVWPNIKLMAGAFCFLHWAKTEKNRATQSNAGCFIISYLADNNNNRNNNNGVLITFIVIFSR